jgi:alginate O-acetyltransferase complex protein AlgI
MLFNSYLFLTIFLPLALGGYYLFGSLHVRLAAAWLCLSSFVFYGWWNPLYVFLLVGSIAFNYAISSCIFYSAEKPKLQYWVTALGVSANLVLLFYYKYLVTFLEFVTHIGLTDYAVSSIVLPLGISFFTFTQIGYLLDARAGLVSERGMLNYVLFVTFFPHLIAGPILHHREIMPQFADSESYKFRSENISVGGTLFIIGLAKKVLFADGIAHWAEEGFAGPAELQFYQAWGASLSYALQLYFDFSGYSDMALGLAKMFGVRFPLNFNSPYKSSSIIGFWQSWHITLTRYLTAYLFSPVALTISRRRAMKGLSIGLKGTETVSGFTSLIVVPMVLTMAIAGVWHGAGFQFLVFGLLHAAYLIANHAWRIFGPRANADQISDWFPYLKNAGYVLLTMVAVLVAQAFFRANSTPDAIHLLQGMMGMRGIEQVNLFPIPTLFSDLLGGHTNIRVEDAVRLFFGRWSQALQIGVLFLIVWIMPNSTEIMGRYSPALGPVAKIKWQFLQWRQNLVWTLLTFGVLFLTFINLGKEVRFLYFQF